MGRSADYTIQGFLYQFNKTLLEILNSPDDSVVTAEGIIEDVEIAGPDITKAIQCKYHETQQTFAISSLYKPLLQMMEHHVSNSNGKVSYQLFAHFPNINSITITAQHLEEALSTTNKNLNTLAKKLKGIVDVNAFLQNFSIEVGPALNVLVAEVCTKLETCGFGPADVETLAYPNAIQIIADLCIQHDVKRRKITKTQLLVQLQRIKVTAITHWTLALQTRKKLLVARRKQLKTNLAKNARSRYFVLRAESLKDFDSQVVLFIKGYLDKYHKKTAHISTPIFCLDVTEDVFNSIAVRLVNKEVSLNDGRVAGAFNEALFLREPMVIKEKREFQLRLVRWQSHRKLLETPKPDDLFFLGSQSYGGINMEDVTVEELASESFDEINYMMGLNDVSE